MVLDCAGYASERRCEAKIIVVSRGSDFVAHMLVANVLEFEVIVNKDSSKALSCSGWGRSLLKLVHA